MATTTKTVCDACGRSEIKDFPTLEQLNIEITHGMSVKLDVHNRPKCIAKAVATAAEKYFASANGSEPESES